MGQLTPGPRSGTSMDIYSQTRLQMAIFKATADERHSRVPGQHCLGVHCPFVELAGGVPDSRRACNSSTLIRSSSSCPKGGAWAPAMPCTCGCAEGSTCCGKRCPSCDGPADACCCSTEGCWGQNSGICREVDGELPRRGGSGYSWNGDSPVIGLGCM
jgi:hypothetical protein